MIVRLRPWRIEDIPRFQELVNDPGVVRYMSHFSYPYTVEMAETWIRNAMDDNPPKYYAIEADGIVVGEVGIHPGVGFQRAGVATIGYWLGSAYWGRGVATEAVRQTVKIGAAAFRRLQASVHEPNVASARVLEKNGFKLEGRRRLAFVERDGTPCDELLYGYVSVS